MKMPRHLCARSSSTMVARRRTTSGLMLLFLLLRCSFSWLSLSAFPYQLRGGPSPHPHHRRRRPSFLHTRSDNVEDVSSKYDLNLFLLDHYDSFTYNLVDLFAQLCVKPPLVYAADSCASWQELVDKEEPQTSTIDGIILSPGPGHPRDCHLAMDLIRNNPNVPILGVCLGHQALALYYGANISLSPKEIHGQVWTIDCLDHEKDGLLKDFDHLAVTRYHSLCVQDHDDAFASAGLKVTAVSRDDHVCMALQHVARPHYGLQFHPESIGTPKGKLILDKFCQICRDNKSQRKEKKVTVVTSASAKQPKEASVRTVMVHKVQRHDSLPLPQDVVRTVCAGESFSYWLDGASSSTSILGTGSKRVEYWGSNNDNNQKSGLFVYKDEECKVLRQDILSYLQEEHRVSSIRLMQVDFEQQRQGDYDGSGPRLTEISVNSVPFDFFGGHVGYLGYEVRHDTARYLEQQEHGKVREDRCAVIESSQVPMAAFIYADKSYVYDHATGDWYLVGVVDETEDTDSTLRWIQEAARRLYSILVPAPSSSGKEQQQRISVAKSTCAFVPNRSRETYGRNIERCLEHIRQGESYELCLTNHLESTIPTPADPLDLYNILRRRNPAPYSAFFDWNSAGLSAATTGSLAICCSSPERFLSVKRFGSTFQAEAKPIKGTCARVLPSDGMTRTEEELARDIERAQELQSSIKNRAENLMIVDLLRNDLSRVCIPGSVHVSKLMDIESFATVHQMVSTIRGELGEASAIDVLRACFPGGSMTGAPKLRTMDLLDEIEEAEPRGPYSGCLGYISFDGSMDFNIVIRTAVLTAQEKGSWHVRIGAGGAITSLSDSDDEYEEMLLKTSAVVNAVKEWAGDDSSPTVETPLRETWQRNETVKEQLVC